MVRRSGAGNRAPSRAADVEAIPDDPAAWGIKVRGAATLAGNLAQQREDALLYKKLASLVTDVPLEESLDDLRIIRGLVPIAEMFAYSSALRGATQGRGSFSMELEQYRPVPASIAEKILSGDA